MTPRLIVDKCCEHRVFFRAAPDCLGDARRSNGEPRHGSARPEAGNERCQQPDDPADDGLHSDRVAIRAKYPVLDASKDRAPDKLSNDGAWWRQNDRADRKQLFNTIAPDRRNDPEVGKMGAHRIDHCGLLTDEQMARAVEHQAAMLLERLSRHKPHVCSGPIRKCACSLCRAPVLFCSDRQTGQSTASDRG
jgi:hypothetical protein